jgi:signal peptidase I
MEGDGLTGDDMPGTGTGGDAAAAEKPEPRAEQAAPQRRPWLTEMVVLVIVALTIALTIKTYLVQPFQIPSGSMENTLLIGDKVLVNKLVVHVSDIHRGDIVVFNGAGSWDPPVASPGNPLDRIFRNFLGLFGDDSGQTDYIKRVIGLPGDHVRCCNARGLITVNGVPLHESSYLYPGSAPSTVRFNIVVPPGRLWVMGDNREDSEDSRFHHCGLPGAVCESWDPSGTIPESMVVGRAFVIVWPPGQFRVLSVPTTFNQVGLRSSAAGARSGSAEHGAGATLAAAAGLRVQPASPALPLAAGTVLAVPVMLLERRIRLRRNRRA